MTNLPSSFTTAGLNVPADSNPSPRGDTMGSGESLVHFPKGGASGGAAMAIAAHNTSSGSVNCLATRPTEFNSFRIAFIPPLRIELGDTMLQRRFLPFKTTQKRFKTLPAAGPTTAPGPAQCCQAIGHHD